MTPLPDRDPLPTCVKGLDRLPDGYSSTIRDGLRAALLGAEAAGAGSIRAADGSTASAAAPTAERHVEPPAVLTEAQLEAIGDHVRLLMVWNEAINLSGIRTSVAIAREHVLDSLTAIPILRRAAIDEFVDLGSGGGYPGIPLAVALPARRALLVESIAKKARFLAVAVEAIGIGDRVTVAATRAEVIAVDAAHRGRWSGVVARAVADLTDLAELSLPLLRKGGLLIAWKRWPVDEELDHAQGALRVLGGRIAAVEAVAVPGLEDHALAVIEKVAETPREYPRDPAARRRNPL
jgi:16S rRNA (guanine527-N7)-methyltransferase